MKKLVERIRELFKPPETKYIIIYAPSFVVHNISIIFGITLVILIAQTYLLYKLISILIDIM
jgi:hypothetical protein